MGAGPSGRLFHGSVASRAQLAERLGQALQQGMHPPSARNCPVCGHMTPHLLVRPCVRLIPTSFGGPFQMQLVFVDLDGQFTTAIREEPEWHNEMLALTCDIGLLPMQETVFVSPSNSLCFMDGGVDARYMSMWPGIEKQVQARMRALGFLSKLGRSYLPLASAMPVPVPGPAWLIMAPTMWLPQDVAGTDNAFFACLAALIAAELLPVQRVIIPAMCTGYGKMAPDEAARQCMRAVVAWRDKTHNDAIAQLSSDFVQLRTTSPQPRIYMNMEWQEFP